jgi:pimeloyl-ACP methyl ester carboxylesterase
MPAPIGRARPQRTDHAADVAPARPAAAADAAGRARPSGPAADGFAVTAGRTSRAEKPYAALAARGEFTGFVKIAGGQEVFVSVKLGKNPEKNPPLVMLDGIAARHERNTTFENLVKKEGQSMVAVFLPGQGETLAKDMEAGGKSLRGDIEQEDQARVVVGVLDALGIKSPVGVAGLSYGGAIAAQCEKQFPDRFSKVMVVAPFVRSQSAGNPMTAFMNNPWNPFGASMYRSAVKSTLQQMFPASPEVLKQHRGAFHEGLFRLTMGLEDFDLAKTVKGMKDVHFLVVPEDGASPPEQNAKAYAGIGTGSFQSAPAADAGKHDLVRGNGALVADWLADVMAGRVEARAVR